MKQIRVKYRIVSRQGISRSEGSSLTLNTLVSLYRNAFGRKWRKNQHFTDKT